MEIKMESENNTPISKASAARIPLRILVSKSRKNTGPIIMLNTKPVITAFTINSNNVLYVLVFTKIAFQD